MKNGSPPVSTAAHGRNASIAIEINAGANVDAGWPRKRLRKVLMQSMPKTIITGPPNIQPICRPCTRSAGALVCASCSLIACHPRIECAPALAMRIAPAIRPRMLLVLHGVRRSTSGASTSFSNMSYAVMSGCSGVTET